MFEELLHINTNFLTILRKLSYEEGITLQQSLILFHISSAGISMSNLADRLGLNASTITRNIEKLENKHLIYRQKCSSDSRKVNVYKSKNGASIGNSIETKANKVFKNSIDQTNTLKDLLQKMNWKLTIMNEKND